MSDRADGSALRSTLERTWPALLLLGLATIAWQHPSGSGLPWLLALVIASAVGLDIRPRATRRIAPLLLATCGFHYVGGFVAMWPFSLLLPVLVCAGLNRSDPRLRPVGPACPLGTVNKSLMLVALVLGLISVGVLLAWRGLVDPQLLGGLSPYGGGSFLLIAIGGLGFAFVNAVVEELYFRGFLQAALSESPDSVHAPVVLQALFFGFMHLAPHSVPHGISGVILTGIFGLVLGYLRTASKGLAAPILAHLIADLGVVVLVMSA